MKYLNKNLALEVLSIPTFTKKESMMADFIEKWAESNFIFFEKDSYGNLYLTKGITYNSEFFPCLTAHLDTVHKEHIPFIETNELLTLESVDTLIGTKVYVDGMGIGGDDKAGIAIILSLFEYFDTLKAVFFVEEEGGSFGSQQMNKEWFNDVGYVIGYDSPELNRAAYSSKGNRLFSTEFFNEHLKDICQRYGLTNFKAELNTDVRVIRENVSIQCMNFGSGYYCPHTKKEYVILEDMNNACGMGKEIINSLDNKLYYFEKHSANFHYIYYDAKKYLKKWLKKIYKKVLTNINTNNLKVLILFCIFASSK